MKFYRSDEVRRAACGRWIDVLSRLGVDASLLSNRHGPCPGCGGKDRFRFDDREGTGSWICSQGGAGQLAGDGINLLEHVTGKDWQECTRMIGEIVLGEAGMHQGRSAPGSNVGVAAAPLRPREAWIPEYDLKRLRGAVHAVPEVSENWFIERSPVDPRQIKPGEFLEHVFAPGDRVLVFTEFRSQGDFLWQAGRGGFRLGAERGLRAVRSALPTDGGRDGVWFLCNPVDGQWHGNPRQGGRHSRRSQESVTAWRHLILENDEAKKLREKARELRRTQYFAEARELEEQAAEAIVLWRRFLAMVPVPVKAIYSSGGDSWHALVQVDMPSKAAFDGYLRGGGGTGPGAKRVLPIFGADPCAMTPVRLSRLPGCTRGGKLQRLIYLAPRPAHDPVSPIFNSPPLRRV